jgi:hypothetical protein
MIWILVIILTVLLISFLTSFNKDNEDLQGITLSEKFEIIVDMINQVAFHGNGEITQISKREFNLYETGQHQIINFLYGTGHLTITWKYKFFQKEIIHKKQFTNVRNLSLFEQQKIGEQMIEEMAIVINNHQNDVLDY